MVRLPWRLGILLLAVAARPAVAADPASTQPAVANMSSDALLAALSMPGWRDRRDAIHELYALGPDAETKVHELLRRDLNQEQRKNVERALQLIADNRQLGATLISLHLKQATAANAMQAFLSQSAGDIPFDPEFWKRLGSQKVTLDVDREPFWDVLRTLSTQLNFAFINDAQELQFSRGVQKVADGISTDGAFLFGANAYTTRRSLIVEIIACGEPKVPVIRTLDLTIHRGVDDQGNVLLSQSGRGGMGGRRGNNGFMGARRWGGPTREGPRLVNAIFQHPQDGVIRVAELTGQITISVQSGSSSWEIDEPINMSPVTRTIDSIPVTIHALRGDGDSYELRASVPFGWSDTTVPASEIMDLMRRNMQLLDASGKALQPGTPDPQRGTATTDITLDFTRGIGKSRVGAPARIVWQVPESRKVSVPFAFKNLTIDGF